MANYYQDENFYEAKSRRTPWALIIILMLLAALGGGVFSYYLTSGDIDARISNAVSNAAVTQSTLPDGTATQNTGNTVINTTQMMLSPEAMQTLLDTKGSSSMIDLIYGEIADIYEEVSPSIVGISNIVRYSSYYSAFGGFGGFNRRNQDNTQEIEQSSGSGVIFSSDGYIVTNYHVIEGSDRLTVSLYDGSTEEASVVGYDARTDLALIKIERTGLPAASFGASAGLRVGDFALAIGNPGGETFSRSLTSGTISGLDRIVTTSEGFSQTMIQTDAAINPGNSGGALVNSRGEVIGINTVKISNTAYEGMGFAIPIDSVQQIISDLKQYQKVIRPALGVNLVRDVDSVFATYNKLSVNEGVLVSPLEGGSADLAGMENYDIITAIDGEKVTSSDELQNIVFAHQIGDTVTVTVYRYTTDSFLDIKVTLQEM